MHLGSAQRRDLQHVQHAEAHAAPLPVGALRRADGLLRARACSTTSWPRRTPRPAGVIYYCPLKPGRVQDLLQARRVVLVLRRHRPGEPRQVRRHDLLPRRRRALRQPVRGFGADLAGEGPRRPPGDALPGGRHDPPDLHAGGRIRLALKIRYPAWARAGVTVRVNGRREAVSKAPGSYLTLDREWRKGDVVAVRLPMSLRPGGAAGRSEDGRPPLRPPRPRGRPGPGRLERCGALRPERAARCAAWPPVEVPALVAADPRKLLAASSPVPSGCR